MLLKRRGGRIPQAEAGESYEFKVIHLRLDPEDCLNKKGGRGKCRRDGVWGWGGDVKDEERGRERRRKRGGEGRRGVEETGRCHRVF